MCGIVGVVDRDLARPVAEADLNRMVRTLQRFAEGRGYVLAAVIGRHAYDTHYYYVRADCPDAEAIIRTIRETPYPWDGQPTGNYAP